MSELTNGARARVQTGHPELDEVLGGGFPANSINVIMGLPGTGKTILAQQTLFHNAGRGRPVVYLSTLSEPLSKVVSYLQRFTFFDEALMLDSVIYEDLGPDLLEHGVDTLISRVREIIKELGPAILVIDSFKAVHDLSTSPVQMRRVASGLGGLLSAYDVTSFLIGEYGDDAPDRYPEFAVADGVIQLDRLSDDKRDVRHLRILKLRGTAYKEGSHAFTLSADGLEVYPRLVTPPMPADYVVSSERVTTGTPGLDRILDGGLWRGSSVLVLGPAGSGKTTFGLGFALDGAASGEPSLYVNFQENPSQLARTIESLGIDVSGYLGKSLFLQYKSPVELHIDAVVVGLFRTVRKHDIRRVVIDGLSDLALAADSTDRFHDYLYSIVQHFAVTGVTSVLTLEGHMGAERAGKGGLARYSTLSDVMLALDTDLTAKPPTRTLRVVKARGIRHTLATQAMAIEAGGIRLPDARADD